VRKNRFLATLSAARTRFGRVPPRPGQLWTPALSRLLFGGLVVVLIAAGFDSAAIYLVRGSEGLVLDGMRAITDIGRSHWYLVPAAMLFFTLSFIDWTRAGFRGRARLLLLFGQAAFVFAAVALSGIAANILKFMFGRARPISIDELGAWHLDPFSIGYAFASFPSGHSTTVGAVTAIFILWYPRYWLVIAEIGVVLAATRIAALAHYPSDVAAGLLLGFTATVVLARFLASRRVVFRLQPGRMLPAVVGRPGGLFAR
jgi:membrane-associated phospholipid phosphatase